MLHLSEARINLTLIEAGGLVFFAGGYTSNGNSKTVDIYNPATETFVTTEMSTRRTGLTSVTLGNKVFFTGGDEIEKSSIVDIFDLTTKKWSTSMLNAPRYKISAITLGNKAYFIGGNKIDIYDDNTSQWSVFTLPKERFDPQLSILDNNIVIAGGLKNPSEQSEPENSVEFFNTSTQSVSEDCLLTGYRYYNGIYGNNQMVQTFDDKSFYYISNGVINKYDAAIKSWKIALIESGSSDVLFKINSSMYTLKFDSNGGYLGKYSIYSVGL